MDIASSKDGDIATRDTLDAMTAACEVAVSVVKLQVEGAIAIKEEHLHNQHT